MKRFNYRCKLNEKKIYDLLGNNYAYHRNEIEEISKMGKSTLIRTLNALISKGLLVKEGSARATTYKKK